MDDKAKRTIALWRLGVLGALVSARLEHGDRVQLFNEIASRVQQMPDGKVVELSPRTIESWYYAHKQGGFEALYPCTRADCGRSRVITPVLAELILRAKREKPRRSIHRIIRMLERARKVEPGALSRSSVHRLLQHAGASARPVRGPSAERRSFIAEHAGDLWVGDALHGPRVIAPDGQVRKSYMLSQIDNATRFIVHSYFALSEDACAQEYGLKQAILKYGLPRAYYVDHGSAYIAWSLRYICAELGIHLLHAGVQDAEAKGVIERWHRTWREEVGDELPETPIPLDELNAKHWAWLGAEYHARVHDTTKRVPREHLLAEVSEIRRVPRGVALDEVFLHREERVVRKDGTVRWGGGFLEVRADIGEKRVELRFDPTDETALPRVFVDGRFVCDTVPLDRLKNMTRKRARIAGDPAPFALPSGLDPLALIEDEHYRRTRLAGPRIDDDNDQEDEEMIMSEKHRFNLAGYPLPKNAQGKTFYDKAPGQARLARSFQQLIDDPGLGVCTSEAGVGKTTGIRNLCMALPRPDYLVLYFCDTTVSPLDLYRSLAGELGVKPSHRRGQLWADIKRALVHMVDERHTAPVVVIDEAQHLSDSFLLDLSGFLNFAFDSRDLLTLWLVGLPPLARRLHMAQHAALATRIAAEVRLEPLDRDTFAAAVDHAFKAAGATQKVLSDPALEMLFRSCRGVLRVASKVLRAALRIAHARGQAFLDEPTLKDALDEVGAT